MQITDLYKKNKLRYHLKLLIFILLSAGISVQAQVTDSIPADTITKSRLFVIPVISYSPETSWAFGVGGLYYLRPSQKHPDTHPTLLKLIAVYSLNKQVQTEFDGDVYLHNNDYLISFILSYYKFPESFFGIGNETSTEDEERYTITHPYLRINAERKIYHDFYAGIKTFYEYAQISETEPGGILDSETIPGEEGGLNTGAGVSLKYDSRDNIYYPLKGFYIDLSSVFHTSVLGSEYNYTDHVLDASAFFKTFKSQVLGINFYAKFEPGDPPFNRMAELGGPFRMRGHYEGRYRDSHYMTLQAEYRIPVWRFIGATFFAGTGEVADDLNGFTVNGLKYSFGGGLRLKLLPNEKINLRIDLGFGGNNNHHIIEQGEYGLYVQFNEAF